MYYRVHQEKNLKTISHSDDRAYGQKDAMNPSGQGYTQFDIFFILVQRKEGCFEGIPQIQRSSLHARDKIPEWTDFHRSQPNSGD